MGEKRPSVESVIFGITAIYGGRHSGLPGLVATGIVKAADAVNMQPCGTGTVQVLAYGCEGIWFGCCRTGRETTKKEKRKLYVPDNLPDRLCLCDRRHRLGSHCGGSRHAVYPDRQRHTGGHRYFDRSDPYPQQGLIRRGKK